MKWFAWVLSLTGPNSYMVVNRLLGRLKRVGQLAENIGDLWSYEYQYSQDHKGDQYQK